MGTRIIFLERPDPSHPSRDPTFRVRSVLGLQRPDQPDSEAALRLRTQRLGQGAAGPKQGPASDRGLGNLLWSPNLLAARLAQFCLPRAGLGTRSQSPGDAAGSRPRRPAPGCGGGGREGPGAVANDQERAPALRCAAPRRPCPPLPSPPPRTQAPGPILGNPQPPSLVPWLPQPEPMTHLVFQTEPASPSPKLAWPVCAVHRRDCVCGHVYICANGCTCVWDSLQVACYVCLHAAFHVCACTPST